jgi:hypothetical protein
MEARTVKIKGSHLVRDVLLNNLMTEGIIVGHFPALLLGG